MRLSAVPATLVLLAAAVTGCSGGSASPDESAGPTTPAVSVPAGVELTEPGAALEQGAPATAVYAVDDDRRSVLTVTVKSITEGSFADFTDFSLDETTKAATPYYVAVEARNGGPAALGQAAIPLYAFDSTGSPSPATNLVGTFATCPGPSTLPAGFAPEQTVSRCLLFLVPKDATLASIQMRTADLAEPISWLLSAATATPTTAAP